MKWATDNNVCVCAHTGHHPRWSSGAQREYDGPSSSSSSSSSSSFSRGGRGRGGGGGHARGRSWGGGGGSSDGKWLHDKYNPDDDEKDRLQLTTLAEPSSSVGPTNSSDDHQKKQQDEEEQPHDDDENGMKAAHSRDAESEQKLNQSAIVHNNDNQALLDEMV